MRELLTTPLQAQILAVVVRDGERPPDRRWKLYDRFYDVIRRREANRNLPDARLARLLREDEKLLKTLHNRIGFRLQADAETSEGAETSLDKEAFKVLATRTVAQMEEDHFEQKVEILDKATTERLVLISTPENGTKLRFDIRQLQEFFAAECLYDSVKAEEMRSRIALIAGDAHWREVIHFLLSSLVENDRSTELSVAIEELHRQNEGDTDGADRMLNRRAGKGALIAARLLSEGVLEQDKATRQRFRDCLTPMAAFANVDRLHSLIGVRHTNSSTWLLNFLLDKLRESAYAENIGAAIVLCCDLPDGHARVAELIQFLNKAPGNYIAAALESYMTQMGGDEEFAPSEWFSALLLQLLAKPNWVGIGIEAIRQAAWIIERGNTRQRIASETIAPEYVSLLEFLTLPWHERYVALGVGSGNVRVLEHSVEPAIAEATSKLDPNALLGEAPGVFRIIQLALQYSNARSRPAYIALLRGISVSGRSLLSTLLAALHIPIPEMPSAKAINAIATSIDGMTEEQFHEWLRTTKVPAAEAHSQTFDFAIEPRAVNVDDIEACFEYSPAAALELIVILMHHAKLRAESESGPIEAIGRLVPRLISDPTPLLSVPWSWNILLSNAGADSASLRNVLFKRCRAALPYKRDPWQSFLFHRFPVVDVILSIFKLFARHGEASLLPYFTDVLLSHLRIYGDVAGYHSHRHAAIPPELGNDIETSKLALTEIMNETEHCWSIRCSAAMLLMFVAGSEETPVASVARLFVDHCNSLDGEWLRDALVTTLSISGRKPNPALMSLMRDLFDSCREDYCTRASLEQVLMFWREASAAPVTTSGVRDRWLFRSDA